MMPESKGSGDDEKVVSKTSKCLVVFVAALIPVLVFFGAVITLLQARQESLRDEVTTVSLTSNWTRLRICDDEKYQVSVSLRFSFSQDENTLVEF